MAVKHFIGLALELVSDRSAQAAASVDFHIRQ
jgi:hypothetical protein